MLLAVFFFDYFIGELLYSSINAEYFLFYFALVALVDATICKFLLKFVHEARAFIYASLSIASIFLHFMGAWMYQNELSSSSYIIGLWVVLVLKLTLLDKAIKDVGLYIFDSARWFYSRLVCSAYCVAFARY